MLQAEEKNQLNGLLKTIQSKGGTRTSNSTIRTNTKIINMKNLGHEWLHV